MNHSGLPTVAFEWPLLACEVAIFGLAVFCAIINAAGVPSGDAVRTRILSGLRFLAIAILIWAPIDLLHQTAEMAAVSALDAIPLVPQVLAGTHAGRIWIARIAAMVALAAAAWAGESSRAKATRTSVVAGLVLVFRALESHAIDDGALAIALYIAHEMFAGVWLGSLLGLWIGYRNAGTGWFAATAPRVSRAAAISVAVLAASGLYAAYDGLGPHPADLVYSAYGRTLLLKLCIAAIAVLIGGYNRLRLIPTVEATDAQAALSNNVAAEVVILTIVLACSAALAATPPVH